MIERRRNERPSASVMEKWNGRLLNWALCFGGARGATPERPAPVSEAYEDLENWRDYATDFKREGQAGVWEAPEPPGITVDAIDTNSLVEQLPDDLYDAVDAYWHMSGPVEVRAAGIGVHVATLYRRRDQAVLELERLDQARKAAALPASERKRLGVPGVVVRRTTYVPDDWAY